MKRILVCLWLAVSAAPTVAAETGAVTEAFGCTLNDGKTMADLDAVTQMWQQHAAGVRALDGYFAAILVPYSATSDYDFVWVGNDTNLNSWAASDAPYMAAGGAAVEARFAQVADCDSGLYFSTDIHNALPMDPSDNDAVVESYGCTLLDGKTLADLKAPHAAFAAANKAINASDPGLTKVRMVQWTPYLANTPYDVIYLTVNDDLESFARDATAYVTSKEGQLAEAEWAKVVECESGLWRSRVIHRPREQ